MVTPSARGGLATAIEGPETPAPKASTPRPAVNPGGISHDPRARRRDLGKYFRAGDPQQGTHPGASHAGVNPRQGKRGRSLNFETLSFGAGGLGGRISLDGAGATPRADDGDPRARLAVPGGARGEDLGNRFVRPLVRTAERSQDAPEATSSGGLLSRKRTAVPLGGIEEPNDSSP